VLLLLCYINVAANTAIHAMIQALEDAYTPSITEEALEALEVEYHLHGFEEHVRLALASRGWLYYGPDEGGAWHDDTRTSVMDGHDLRFDFDRGRIEYRELPEGNRTSSADEPDARGWRWH
jgi:hypothetical protein